VIPPSRGKRVRGLHHFVKRVKMMALHFDSTFSIVDSSFATSLELVAIEEIPINVLAQSISRSQVQHLDPVTLRSKQR
jgi:hypothetical protein